MYTVIHLQEKLEKAKDTLREVEDNLQKVDGKPTGNPTLRFSKTERGWQGQNRKFNIESFPRRRVSEYSVDDGGKRKAFQQDEGSRRKGLEEEGVPRRRIFPAFAEEGSIHRKRAFLSDDENDDDDTSPVRKKTFQSVVGKVNLPDLNIALKRGRERREREKESGNGPRPRSIFARLSGAGPVESRESEEDEEDECILKRQPVLHSRVQAIEHPAPSREEVLAKQKEDIVGKQRDRRMFGALLGTLHQFRREETQVKQKEERRLQIERKLEDDARREKERLQEEKRSLQMERKRREADIKRIEWSLNRVKEFAAWEADVIPLKNFIQTKSQPHIFYLPKIHLPKTEEALLASAKVVQEMIDKRLASLNEEIQNSEIKARRAAVEVDDINKENEAVDDSKKEEVVVPNEENEGLDDVIWEEAHYDGSQERIDDTEKRATGQIDTVIISNEETRKSILCEEPSLPINGGDKNDKDNVHSDQNSDGQLAELNKDKDAIPPLLESTVQSTDEADVSEFPSLKDTEKTTSRASLLADNASKMEEVTTVCKMKTMSRSPEASNSRSRSSSMPKKPAKTQAASAQRSRSQSKSRSPSSTTDKRDSLKKRKSRSITPKKRSVWSRSRSSSRDLSKKKNDDKARRSRSRSRRRATPTRRRSGSRSRRKSRSPRRKRSRSAQRRRQRRSRTRSGGRSRYSRASRWSLRKRSRSPVGRQRKRSSSSSSSSSHSD